MYEDITNNRRWGEIREISDDSFDKIISHSNKHGNMKLKDFKGDDYDFNIKNPIQNNNLILYRNKVDRSKKSSKTNQNFN